MGKTTMKDIARHAGVSQTTVSFVVNGLTESNVSDETRERVLQAIADLQYVPPKKRLSKKQASQQVIGVIIPTYSNPFYPYLIQQLEIAAADKGYRLIVCNTYRRPENEQYYLNLMIHSGMVGGIIFAFAPSDAALLHQVAEKIPLVNFTEKQYDTNYSIIGLNSVRTGEIIAQHLMDLGHRHIAYVTTPLDTIALSRQKRLEGIRQRMSSCGLAGNLVVEAATHEEERYDSAYEMHVGRALTQKLLGQHPEVTAIIGANDMVGIGVASMVQTLGLCIPQDVSVCGFDNIALSDILTPKLTTIDHHINHKARLAIDVLHESMHQEASGTDVLQIEYEPKLIVRESTGRVRSDE